MVMSDRLTSYSHSHAPVSLPDHLPICYAAKWSSVWLMGPIFPDDEGEIGRKLQLLELEGSRQSLGNPWKEDIIWKTSSPFISHVRIVVQSVREQLLLYRCEVNSITKFLKINKNSGKYQTRGLAHRLMLATDLITNKNIPNNLSLQEV